MIHLAKLTGPRGNLGILVGRWTDWTLSMQSPPGVSQDGAIRWPDAWSNESCRQGLGISNLSELSSSWSHEHLFRPFCFFSSDLALRSWGYGVCLARCWGWAHAGAALTWLMNVISAWQRQIKRIPSLQFWPGHDPWVLAWALPCAGLSYLGFEVVAQRRRRQGPTSFVSTWRQQVQWLLSILAKIRDRHCFTSFSLLLQFFNTWGCFMSMITETPSFWSFCHFQNLSNLMKHRLNWDLVFSMGQNLEDFNSRIVNIPGLSLDDKSNSCNHEECTVYGDLKQWIKKQSWSPWIIVELDSSYSLKACTCSYADATCSSQ